MRRPLWSSRVGKSAKTAVFGGVHEPGQTLPRAPRRTIGRIPVVYRSVFSAATSVYRPCTAVGQAQPCMARGRKDGVYRCDIRSVQQESGGGRRGLRREPGAKGAKGVTSIGDAWGVRIRARVCGQERQNQRYERRGMDAGGPGGREPPRRLSGGQCGGVDGRRAKHAAGGDGSGVDTSAGGDAEAGAG